jgi:hypothetical protein
LLQDKKLGVVAHFFMDPKLEGVLQDARHTWPHVAISPNAAAMGKAAVEMVESGAVDGIVVMGVDVLSATVRATVEMSHGRDVPTYRLSEEQLGLNLADAGTIGPLFDGQTLSRKTFSSRYEYFKQGLVVVPDRFDNKNRQAQILLGMPDLEKLLQLTAKVELGANQHLVGYHALPVNHDAHLAKAAPGGERPIRHLQAENLLSPYFFYGSAPSTEGTREEMIA